MTLDSSNRINPAHLTYSIKWAKPKSPTSPRTCKIDEFFTRETWTCSCSAAAFMEASIMREMTTQRSRSPCDPQHFRVTVAHITPAGAQGCAQVGKFRLASQQWRRRRTNQAGQAAHLPRAGRTAPSLRGAAGSRRDNHKYFTWGPRAATMSSPHGGLCGCAVHDGRSVVQLVYGCRW